MACANSPAPAISLAGVGEWQVRTGMHVAVPAVGLPTNNDEPILESLLHARRTATTCSQAAEHISNWGVCVFSPYIVLLPQVSTIRRLSGDNPAVCCCQVIAHTLWRKSSCFPVLTNKTRYHRRPDSMDETNKIRNRILRERGISRRTPSRRKSDNVKTRFIRNSVFSINFYLQSFLLFLLFSLLLSGLYYGRQHVVIDNANQLIQNRELHRLTLIQQIARSHIDGLISDALLLSRGETLSRYLNSRKPMLDRVYVEKEFVTMSRARAIYDQIRYLDRDGQEHIRVNYNNGDPAIVPMHLLQDKSNRYYFRDSFNLDFGDVYISPLDLNKEGGKIELPYKPMIRIGTTVVDGYGRKKGVLLLNYYGERILSKIEFLLSGSAGEPMLLNSDGYWLLGSHDDDLWGFMFGKNTTMEQQQPVVWQKIHNERAGTVIHNHEIYHHITIPLTYGGDLDSMQQNYWKLVVRITPKRVLSADNMLLSHLLVIVAASLLASWFVSYMLHQKRYIGEMRKLSLRVMNNSAGGIFVTDRSNRIIAINPAFTEITGYEFEEIIGERPSYFSSGQHPRDFYESMWNQLHDTGEWAGEIWNRDKAGNVFPAWLSISVIRGKQGRIQYYVAMFDDITVRKNEESRLIHKAHYDFLTDLPNRPLFRENLKRAISEARRNRQESALLFLDLDKFKEVNDTMGHAAGDQLLVEVAKRVRTCIRESDLAARLGGDEFSVLLSNVDSIENTEGVAKKILARMREPFLLSGDNVNISVSIGIVMFSGESADIDSLLNSADQAMYKAKQSGRDRIHFL